MENKFLRQAILAWELQVSRLDRLITSLGDEELEQHIAPGRNSGWYILGHLIAVNDAMSEILGTGKRSYPGLHAPFIQNPEHAGSERPSVSTLRTYLKEVHERLGNEFQTLSEDAWFHRHNAMTDEEFTVNPDRNKLSVLLNRTNHLSYHLGQLRLLK